MQFFKAIFLLIFISLILWLPATYRRCFYPFRLNKCLIQWPHMPEWELTSTDPIQKQKIDALLKQPFSYFDRGSQSFVFLSEDKQYILKLFQFDTSPISIGKNLLKQCKLFLRAKIAGDRPPHPILIKNTFDSCKIAYDTIRKRTALEYIHINPTPIFTKIHLKDRFGISHKIDSTHFRFVIQKKCTPFLSTDQSASEKEKHALLESYLSMFDEFRTLHVANRDLAFNKNFGFLDGYAIAFDVGNFYLDPNAVDGDFNHFTTKVYEIINQAR